MCKLSFISEIKDLSKKAKNKSDLYCFHCGNLQPIYNLERNAQITITTRSGDETFLTARDIYVIFYKLSAEDLNFMGLSPDSPPQLSP